MHSGVKFAIAERSQVPELEPLSIPRARALGVGASEAFARDVLCRGCGYNLRGVAILGRCPECNHENREALIPNDLRLMDRAWLTQVLLGLRIAFVGLWLTWVLPVGLFVGLVATIVQARFTDKLELVAGIVVGGAPALGAMAILIGAVLATPRAARMDVLKPVRRLRRAARWSAVLLMFVAMAGVVLLAGTGGRPSPAVLPLLLVMWSLLALFSFAFPRWVEELIERAIDSRRLGGGAMLRIIFPGAVLLGGFLVTSLLTGWGPTVGVVLAMALLIAVPLSLLLLTVEVWQAVDVLRKAERIRDRQERRAEGEAADDK